MAVGESISKREFVAFTLKIDIVRDVIKVWLFRGF